ncbi:MAG TPA: ABC transporter transmembrane domain-containing protein, partial [Jatrophihabitans sp.]|nr:ABC transporter transmembrane domain-containing protein [Jatrophihabitans sp.]
MRQQPGRLRDVLRRYRIRLASGLFALIAAGVAGAGNPLLIKVMLDRGLYPPDGVRQRTVILIALAMVGLAVAAAAAGLVATYFGEGVIHAYVRDLRTELFGSLARLPLAELQTRRMGELSARFVGDLGLIESVLENAGMGVVSNGLFLLASIAAMAYLSIPLCLGSLALTPLLVWLTRRIAARQATLTGQLQEEVGALAVVVDDNLSSAGAIQARLFDRVPASVADFGGIADRLYRLQLRRAMLLGRLDASLGVFFAAVPALV